MRNDVCTWIRFSYAFSITFLILAVFNFMNFEIGLKIVVSCLALVFCLVVCIVCLKPAKPRTSELAHSVFIEETVDDLHINYDLKGVNMQDVEYALSELERWKDEHNFIFDIGRKSAKLRLYFTDTTKKSVSIISSNITDNVKYYEGIFSFYTQKVSDGVSSRRFKIDDIQLGCLDISLLNLDDYVNKKCSIAIRNDKLISCVLIEGGNDNG